MTCQSAWRPGRSILGAKGSCFFVDKLQSFDHLQQSPRLHTSRVVDRRRAHHDGLRLEHSVRISFLSILPALYNLTVIDLSASIFPLHIFGNDTRSVVHRVVDQRDLIFLIVVCPFSILLNNLQRILAPYHTMTGTDIIDRQIQLDDFLNFLCDKLVERRQDVGIVLNGFC